MTGLRRGRFCRGLVVSPSALSPAEESAWPNDPRRSISRRLRRFFRAVGDLLGSEVRGRAIGLMALLLAFALSVNGLNVVSSYVGRDFMTAVARRDKPGFVRLAVIYIGLFALMSAVVVLYRFAEERLGLLWRSWLTRKVTRDYLDGRTYLRLRESAEIDNPDERISAGIRTFITPTLSFPLIILNSTLAAISFSGVLWTISPPLLIVAVLYTALGVLASSLLGRPLVGLNYRQSDREADYRSALIHVGENAVPIALLRREDQLKAWPIRRIDGLVENSRRIISVNRNLGFFTTGYNDLIQIIPALIIAPRFIHGEVEFGVLAQSTMGFTQLLGAFSLFINQVGSITAFAAVGARLSELAGAVERTDADGSEIETVEDRDRLAYERLTLRSPGATPRGWPRPPCRSPAGCGSWSRARTRPPSSPSSARRPGRGPAGEGGSSARPWTRYSFCLSSRTCPPGSLRDILIPPGQGQDVPDELILAAIRDGGLELVMQRAGGLGAEQDWPATLSLGEQQQLAVSRLILGGPTFAFLDRPSTALGREALRRILERLTACSISYVSFEPTEGSVPVELYDAVLRINADATWSWERIGPADPRPDHTPR